MSRSRLALGLAVAIATAGPVGAKTLLTREEALHVAFPPPARVDRQSLFLSEEERGQAKVQAGTAIESEVWIQYLARGEDGRVIGYAYFETHLVRTLPETLMVAIALDGSVSGVEIVSFSEPGEYLPRAAWFDQFDRRRLDPDLAVSRAIRSVSGATLSSRAATAAVRRVLAVHGVVLRRTAGPAPGGSTP